MSKGTFKNTLFNSFKIFKASVSNFASIRPIHLAGTTAYFAIFSMTPIILIIISVFGYFIGDDIIREKLFNEIAVLIGHDSTLVLRKAITNYTISSASFIGILDIVFFLIAATALFSIMQNSINQVWRIKAKANFKMGTLSFLKKRVLSFGVILCLGFILLTLLLIDASVAFLKDLLAAQFNHNFVLFSQLINVAASLIIITVVFALIYRFLPDVHVQWSASWFGAIFTSVLFALGKIGLGALIVNRNPGAFYGAVGSFAAILVWIFFVSIIFYFGVELTSQYSKFYKHKNKPMKYAVPFQIDKV